MNTTPSTIVTLPCTLSPGRVHLLPPISWFSPETNEQTLSDRSQSWRGWFSVSLHIWISLWIWWEPRPFQLRICCYGLNYREPGSWKALTSHNASHEQNTTEVKIRNQALGDRFWFCFWVGHTIFEIPTSVIKWSQVHLLSMNPTGMFDGFADCFGALRWKGL